MRPRDRLALVRAAFDQAHASATRGPDIVAVDRTAWDQMRFALGVLPPDEAIVPKGRSRGRTLGWIAQTPDADEWFEWATRRPDGWWPLHFKAALDALVRDQETST